MRLKKMNAEVSNNFHKRTSIVAEKNDALTFLKKPIYIKHIN